MLRGIDISANNAHPFDSYLQTLYDESDFVIVKATQGTNYINKYFSEDMARAVADGKLVGMYHYAGGGDAFAEAEFFWSVASAYHTKAIPIIDFEQYQNSANWNNTKWCDAFVTRYFELSGVWCLCYGSAAYRSKFASCADRCGLWIAGYPDSRRSWDIPKFVYSTEPWDCATIWQYTSGGGVDRNIAYLDEDGWNAIATCGGNANQIVTTPSETDSFAIVELAARTINNEFGVDEERKNALGSNYDIVMKEVNHILLGDAETLANEVIAGKYGNDYQRKYYLGVRYKEVQNIVESKY